MVPMTCLTYMIYEAGNSALYASVDFQSHGFTRPVTIKRFKQFTCLGKNQQWQEYRQLSTREPSQDTSPMSALKVHGSIFLKSDGSNATPATLCVAGTRVCSVQRASLASMSDESYPCIVS